MAQLPQVGRRTVEALLDRHAKKLADHSLMLVHGRYAAGSATTFTAEVGKQTRRVTVRDESSVLGILATWHSHRDEAAPGDLLVVTTGVDDDQLGWDVRGHAVHRRTLTVEKAEIVMQRFGATGLDVRMYREDWLLQALVDAEPTGQGWPRIAGVLTRDAALRALVVERLGLDHPDVSPNSTVEPAVDADALLAWSRTPAGPRRFAELADTERAELKKWLGEVAGPAVSVLLSLAETGRGHDAMALGLLGAALRDPGAGPDVVLAVGGLFGQAGPRRGELGAFTDAVEGTLLRWIGEATGSVDARHKVFAVLQRADELAHDAGLTGGLVGSRFLPSSFAAQLSTVVEAARTSPAQGEAALADLAGHALVGLFRDRVRVAEMAVRLARWLRQGAPAVTSVAAGVREHAAEWGWADRALSVLWAGDPGGDPAAAQSLRELYEDGRAQRDHLDEQFARYLAKWVPNATAQQPGGCLVVENVLDTVVRPLTTSGAPLVIVLDGMSSAVAAQLGEEAEREGWREIVPRPAAGERPTRLAAVSMLPSVTRTSRASLLTGTAVQGGQSTEASGFAAFWKKRRKDAALFHKASIGGDAGHFLAQELTAALASDAVVGVVLNTIDDALDSGQQGQRTVWSLGDITYLREMLAAARSYARPVVLVADHGHIIDRGRGEATPAADGGGSARWQPGSHADEGEVVLSGPRVLEGNGSITTPWREDIRYAARRAGYHGGAALAEVTVPVLVLVPSTELAPRDWEPLPREQAAPSWWQATAAGLVEAGEPEQENTTQPKRRQAKPARQQGEGLFGNEDVMGPEPAPETPTAPATLGGRVVASEVYEAQKEYVRKAPESKVVAAVIDALAAAGGTMSPAALAAAISATGRVRRNIEGFVATVQRLLNVEGYPVLGFVDAGHAVKLDIALLRDQFLSNKETP
ncbi:BREX-2 system phosphatase PglZ [Streptomyces sp. ME02-8801-2C]|uniref:BREX-2 system phosphatase PglZ n=1 Tax=Streptomyces sp. ME02-8801-2C TaxID=3028680 RepID=UPI0029B45676|nr:BREX-2 system phosphatase PglZ [Streptomyces sp. ME02-8801-2C]MDX3450861.1 BREX-2 system phosphatase PglZ [Streptomyces sp. ME02-8801-2C]